MFTHILTVGFIPTENDLFLPSLLKDNYPYFDLIVIFKQLNKFDNT